MAVDMSFWSSPVSEELREEGRTRGRAEGQARSLLKVLRARGIDVPDDVRARIESCTDTATLDAWLDGALTATDLAGVFASG
jgi:hypothetical protein